MTPRRSSSSPYRAPQSLRLARVIAEAYAFVDTGVGAAVRALPLPRLVQEWLWLRPVRLADDWDTAQDALRKRSRIVQPASLAHLDERGRVDDVRIARSCGHESLDAAALGVVRSIVFSPAMDRDLAIPAWIQLPLEFAVR